MSDRATSIPFARPVIGEDEVDAVMEGLRTGWLTTGPHGAAYEREFAEFLGSWSHAIAADSASAGLHLRGEGPELGNGDEVIVPFENFSHQAVRFHRVLPPRA
jgi:dTDP-4-amino-4,6-dideoxygalactose transaminase